MLSASVYIITHSARNRLRVRLQRLRQPRYLFGAVVGAAYFYFTVFARLNGRRSVARRRGAANAPVEVLSAVRAAAPAAAGLVLLFLTAVSWIIPFDPGLLDFSEAEIQFLFPAPVSRRWLLVHRMMRSQVSILFSSLLVSLFTPSIVGFTRLRIAIAMWLLMSTAKVYVTGVSLARARLTSGDGRARRVAWLPVVVLLAGLAVVGTSVGRAFLAGPIAGPQDLLVRIGAATTGASHVVLWPFMALTAPLFAEWPVPYLEALAASAAVLVVCVAWVLKSDETFQDAAAHVAEQKAKQPSRQAAAYRARPAGWTIAATGRPEVAFIWKGFLQTTRLVDRRSMARIAAFVFALMIAATSMGRANGLAQILGMFALVGTMFTILMAPQVLRADMRQDLRHLELLKTWPVKPAAVIRGEIAWPGAVLTGVAWALVGVAAFLSSTNFGSIANSTRAAAAAGIAILAPALIFVQLTVHNGLALLFPAWVPLGNQRPRGLDAMGQRLVLLGATWLMLIVISLPGAIAGGIVWFAFKFVVGAGAIVPGALVCTTILALEVLVATEMLAPAYEKIDLTAVERAE
jgi:ABC-2 type transport system permease protein